MLYSSYWSSPQRFLTSLAALSFCGLEAAPAGLTNLEVDTKSSDTQHAAHRPAIGSCGFATRHDFSLPLISAELSPVLHREALEGDIWLDFFSLILFVISIVSAHP